jgi:hypothetical protein
MSSKEWGMFSKTITVRVNEEQYEKYKAFCLSNHIQLNVLVRFLLDRVVAGEDKAINKLIAKLETATVSIKMLKQFK